AGITHRHQVRSFPVCTNENYCSALNIFFFSSRRRHTRFSRDWSSDVCSSDLRKTRKQCLSGGDYLKQRTLWRLQQQRAERNQTVGSAKVCWQKSGFSNYR